MSPLRHFAQFAVVSAVFMVAPGPASAFDPNSDRDVMDAFQRMNCGKNGEQTAYLFATGRAYGHVEGQKDELLFDVDVVNVRQCGSLPATINDVGFRLTSKEVMFYRDPKTKEVLKTWTNPYTGKSVDVLHAANDPVNGNYTAKAVLGGLLPFNTQVSDDMVAFTYEAVLLYDSPLGGAYQKYVGGQYRATEMINFFAAAKDLKSRNTAKNLPAHFSWSRMSNWLPWMEMGGRLGYFYVHTAGQKFETYAEVPERVRTEIDKNYPEFRTPPPLDDTRPNDTSWTFFQKTIDARSKK